MRWLAMLLAVTVALPPQPTPQWSASDQFGRSLRSEEFAGAPVLVIGGGSAAGPTSNQLVISRDGAVLHRSKGVPVDPATATAIAAMLRRAAAGETRRVPEPR